ncbi:MAG: DUF885 domain-containing protein [Chloroflexaceae bacterium]|nr:DUF885 domain-containing protein [Chloroflexaceae bacterium]
MDTVHTPAVAHLTTLIDDFLADFFDFYPIVASKLGLHDYDGRITNLDQSAIDARVERLRMYDQRLSEIDLASLDRMQAFDYRLLRWRIDAELWSWLEDREYQRNPMIYTYNLMVDTYIKRDYAPLEDRAQSLVQHLHQIPAAMQVARQNLKPGLPQALIEEALAIFSGLVTFFTYSLPEAFGRGQAETPLNHRPELERDLWVAFDVAIAAMNDLSSYLREELLPTANPNFALGSEQYQAMLKYNELIDIPLDQLLELGRADLARNQAALAEVVQQIDPSVSIMEHIDALHQHHPPAERLLEETRTMLHNLRSFIIERDLVTLPCNGEGLLVEETPPFERWAFAMMDTAGPFETQASESYYYITLPEPDWSAEQVEAWLSRFDYATLTDISIHEAYPGHFVHFVGMNNLSSRLARVFSAYSHYESWAHYAEQMMLEQGYGAGNLQLRLAQLTEALLRDCRYICSIMMHTQGMSIDEATHFFIEQAYMDETSARLEARRGTHDPGYLNYTLGKLLLLKLLEDYRAAYGDNFSLKRFHDEYIGYGAPPIPILRSMLLPNDNGTLI